MSDEKQILSLATDFAMAICQIDFDAAYIVFEKLFTAIHQPQQSLEDTFEEVVFTIQDAISHQAPIKTLPSLSSNEQIVVDNMGGYLLHDPPIFIPPMLKTTP